MRCSRTPKFGKNDRRVTSRHRFTRTTMLALLIFLPATSLTFYYKALAASESIIRSRKNIEGYWANNIGTLYRIEHLATHGIISQDEYKVEKSRVDQYQDRVAKWGINELQYYKSFSAIPFNETDGVLTAEDLQKLFLGSDSTILSQESANLLTRRMLVVLSACNANISKEQYDYEKQLIWEDEQRLVKQQVLSPVTTEPGQEDVRKLRAEIATLKEEVEGLRRPEGFPYPFAFWMALALAVCSWSVMSYNLLFSILKEKREQRKENREVAAVLPYSESDLQRVLSDAHLAARLKR